MEIFFAVVIAAGIAAGIIALMNGHGYDFHDREDDR